MENRGFAFGFERAMDSAGVVIGPLFGLFLYAWVGLNVRNVFLLSCIPAAIASLLILTVRERRGDVIVGAKNLKLTLAGTTRDYRRLLIVVGVFGLANSANAFLILRAQGLGLSTQSAIMAYALYNAVAALSSIPAGKLSDRLGPARFADFRLLDLRGGLLRLRAIERCAPDLAPVCVLRTVSCVNRWSGKGPGNRHRGKSRARHGDWDLLCCNRRVSNHCELRWRVAVGQYRTGRDVLLWHGAVGGVGGVALHPVAFACEIQGGCIDQLPASRVEPGYGVLDHGNAYPA